MNAVPHLICCKRALDFLDDFLARWNLGERQGARRTLQPVEMFVELKNSAVIQAQPFPDCVAALHCRIERSDSGPIAMHELPVDIDNQVAISLIEFLKHLNYLTQRPLRT